MIANALIRIGRNVRSLSQALDFYTRALGFEPLGDEAEDEELAELMYAGRLRRQRLVLGGREIELTQCVLPPPAGYDRAGGNFTNFQHLALLVPDIRAAYARALDHGAEPISEAGPVTLPPASGGVTAVKFRDPDGHPLEFLQKLGAGYDHSAISVSNVARSIAFYAGIGLVLDGQQVNHGAAQDALDGLDDAQVDVVTLRPPQRSPHVELLGYRHPKAIPCHWNVTELCADRLVFSGAGGGLRLLRDPDGHVVVLDGR